MLDDRYNDQIMVNHLSRTYGQTFIDKFIKEIIDDLGIVQETNNHKLKAIVNNKSVAITMFHAATQNYLATDFFISETVTNHSNHIKLYPEFYGIYYTDYKYDKTLIPNKKINCFVNRSCPFRQSWLYQLIRENILDDAYVSFWSQNFEFPELSPQQLFDYYFTKNTIFETEHLKIKKEIPYKNFDMSLETAIIDSEKSLVIETFFEEEDQISLTEKTMRVLQLPRPWYLFGNPGAVSMLRDWGFDVFDDWVDHSYDSKTSPHERQRLILNQIHSTIPYTKSLLEEFKNRAQNNSTLLKNFQYQYINHKEKKIFDRLKNELR
jgi:hypothetical protein